MAEEQTEMFPGKSERKYETEDQVRRRFLRDLHRSYRFDYSQFESDFIARNKDRNVDTFPYSKKQRRCIELMMKKYLKRMGRGLL